MVSARRWIAAALIGMLLPVGAIASVCSAWCAGERAPATVSVANDASEAAPGEVAAAAPCAAASLCAFAATPAVPAARVVLAPPALADAPPEDPGARSLPAEPAPPLEPPARAVLA